MKLAAKILLLLALAATPPAVANDNFDRALDLFTDCQLAPRVALDNAQADIQDLKNDNRLAAPEAEFSRVWGTKDMGNKWTFSLTQSFDWPGVYGARSRAISAGSDAMGYLHRSAIVDARMEGRLLLIDVVNARRRYAEMERIHNMVCEVEEATRHAYEKQEVTILDFNKITIEHINLDKQKRDAMAAVAVAEDQIRALCGDEKGNEILAMLGDQYPDPTLPPLMSMERLTQADPAISAANANIESLNQTIRVDKLSRLPGFSLGYVHEKELGGSFNGFSVGLTLPWFSNKGKAKATELRRDAAQTDLALQTARRRAAFLEARSNAQAAWEIAERYRPVISGDESFQVLRQALDAGQLTLLDYITEVEYFLAARQSYLDTLYAFHQALAELHRFD